jgi:hypothetical protein
VNLQISAADPHHIDVDPYPDPACHFDAVSDPNPACHFDADPDATFHTDAEPNLDTSYQTKTQNLEKVLK